MCEPSKWFKKQKKKSFRMDFSDVRKMQNLSPGDSL